MPVAQIDNQPDARRKKIVLLLVVVTLLLVGGIFLRNYNSQNKAGTNKALQQYKSKLGSLEQQAKQNPKDVTIQKEYAHTLYVTSNTDKAIAAYNNVTKLNTNDYESYLYLGNLYRKENEYDKAVVAYERSIKLQPSQVNAYINLAHLYLYTLKKPEAGYQVFEKAIAANPRNTDIMLMLARTYEQQKEVAKAKETYEKILAINADNAAAKTALAAINER